MNTDAYPDNTHWSPESYWSHVAAGLVLATALLCWAAPARAATPPRPNVVFILADDLGWTDLHCFGSEFYESPHR